MSEQYTEQERAIARGLRLSIVRGIWKLGQITKTDALELLRGPLTPDDPSTIVDDSALLDLSPSEAMVMLGLKEWPQ